MSSFRVQLNDPPTASSQHVSPRAPAFEGIPAPKGRSKRLIFIAAVLVSLVLVTAAGGYLYYLSFKGTPQYSLAMVVDAARRDDKAELGSLIDIDAVVDDFVPQITGKAIELYGRGMPPRTIAQVERLATPLMPAVKDRARAELPRIIRERTQKFGYVPFFAMVMGADRYLDITITGDVALVKSKLSDHPLEMTMRRNGDRWQIVGVREEQLATDIARKIGQEIIAIAAGGLTKKTADTFGVGNLAELLRQAEEMIR
jgi:hypothetical protein